MLSRKTALLIFSRSIEEELRHKPFLAQKSLVNSLYKHTTDIAKQSGLDVIFYDESKQYGINFGSRFSNALENIFYNGYQNIIAIGNDCPQLQVEHILQAQKSLLNNETIIGGTHDGGFYLLGISKENFNKNTFLTFSWNKKTLYNEVIESISSKSLNYKTLQKLRDIDFYSDLESLSLHTISNNILRNCITSITQKRIKIVLPKNLKESLLSQLVISIKGAPLAFSF